MTRNLKALGLALVAAFAMSAVLAAGAQAEKGVIQTDLGGGVAEATLTGTETTKHKFEGTGTVECGDTLFDGTVKNGDKDLKITPTYKTCTTNIFGTKYTTTVDMTSCYYTFTEGNATAGDPNHFDKITTSLVCPNAGEAVHIKVFKDTVHGMNHVDGNRRCEYTVTPFNHYTNTTATNNLTPTDDVEVVSNVPNVPVKRTFGTFLQCGAENTASTYTGGTTLRAYRDTAHTEQVGLTMTDVG